MFEADQKERFEMAQALTKTTAATSATTKKDPEKTEDTISSDQAKRPIDKLQQAANKPSANASTTTGGVDNNYRYTVDFYKYN